MLIGYIGGTVLSRLINYPKDKSFKITALVRSSEKADKLKSKFGVEPIIGSYAELDKLEDASSKAEIVIAAVSRLNFIFEDHFRGSFAEHCDLAGGLR